MKKLFALVLAMLLSGCAAAPTETTAGTEPAPSVTIVPTTVPTAPPATAPTTLPTEPVKSYESFFSEEVLCPVKDSYGELWLDTQAVYGPNSKESYTLVDKRMLDSLDLPSDTLGRVVLLDKNNKYLRSLSEEKMYEAMPANTEYCAAVSEDQSTLWKLPYAEGAAPEALYTDAYHRLSQPAYFENCLFFMAGVDENTDGIYRLYLPDGTVDLMLDDLPRARRDGQYVYGTVRSVSVISNVEVQYCIVDWNSKQDLRDYWTIPCLDLDGETVTPQAFYAARNGGNYVSYDQYVEDCNTNDCPWYSYGNALHKALFRSQGKYDQHYVYRNFLTDTTRKADSYNVSFCGGEFVFFYPNGEKRSRDMQSQNDFCWWLDPYYTK